MTTNGEHPARRDTTLPSAVEESADSAPRDRHRATRGQYDATFGEIVETSAGDAPFKVVLHFRDGNTTEHPCETVRDGKDYIRRCTPSVPVRAIRD